MSKLTLDEQGDYWPPAPALAAFLTNFAYEPQYDGVLVEVSAYLPEYNFFETVCVERFYVSGKLAHRVGDILYARPRELSPINEHTRRYIKHVTEVVVEMYDTDVYDLRDKLAAIDVHVTADAVSKWTGAERTKIWIYANEIDTGNVAAIKPKELP